MEFNPLKLRATIIILPREVAIMTELNKLSQSVYQDTREMLNKWSLC